MLLQRTALSPLLGKAVVTRFAPSPTGQLHLGHLLHLLYLHTIAKQLNARVLLRMENHDAQRSRGEYVDAIEDDLAWLGLLEAFSPVPDQLSRIDRYETVVQQLLAKQLAYRCDCSRKQIARSQPEGDARYSGRCRTRALPASETTCVRLQLPDKNYPFNDLTMGKQLQNPYLQCGDFPLQDRIGQYTYHLAVVLDDLDDGVNLIIRGADLLHCTGRQQALRDALGVTKAPLYLHHPLIHDREGDKLSKKTSSTSLKERRAAGATAEQLIGEALFRGQLLADNQPCSLTACEQIIFGDS